MARLVMLLRWTWRDTQRWPRAAPPRSPSPPLGGRQVPMSTHRFSPVLIASAVTVALAGWPASALAQFHSYEEGQAALVFAAQGGAYSPLAHLDDANNADFNA